MIPTVTSQSVLCSDSPIFQWSFLFTRLHKEEENTWCLRLTVCHFHVQNSYYQLCQGKSSFPFYSESFCIVTTQFLICCKATAFKLCCSYLCELWFYLLKPLSHRYPENTRVMLLRHLFPDRQICCIHTASDFPESVRAFTHNRKDP